MAKNYAEMSTEELQKLAEDQKNRRAAIRELAQSGADPSILSSLGSADRQTFLMEREQKRVDDWHAANDKARATRMKGILGEEGGRYSPVTIANARKYLEENGYGQEGERRRQSDVTNETERIKAKEHANGLINQGKTQAEIKAAAEREISRNKDGWWDDQGNFHPGASVKAAEATGQAKIDVQEKKNEGAATVQDKRNEGAATIQDKKNQSSSERNQTLENISTTHANATVEAARLRQQRIDERRAQQDALAEQRDFEKFKKDINNLMNTQFSSEDRMKFNAMKPEEQKAFWKDYQGRQQEQQLPKVEGYTPERVAELIKRGYKVVDGKFVK